MFDEGIYHEKVNHLTIDIEAELLKHKPVTLYHNNYRLTAECGENNHKVIKAKIIGEYFKSGQLRTLVKCKCCETFFELDHLECMFFRGVLPEFKTIINSRDDKNVGKDLPLIETLELMVEKYSLEDFTKIVYGQIRIEEAVINDLKKIGFNNCHSFYNEMTEKLKRVANI
jgi:hypothetical protein